MNSNEKIITGEVIVNANIEKVWEAWTTEEGIKTFFAPDCHIELKVDGLYEMYFDTDAKIGTRGSEGMRILAIQPYKILSFTWSAPPHLKEIRKQRTYVVVRFEEIDNKSTKVTLINGGYGVGGEWEEAYDYFVGAWKKIVLPRLEYRFRVGPIDWDNPYYLNE